MSCVRVPQLRGSIQRQNIRRGTWKRTLVRTSSPHTFWRQHFYKCKKPEQNDICSSHTNLQVFLFREQWKLFCQYARNSYRVRQHVPLHPPLTCEGIPKGIKKRKQQVFFFKSSISLRSYISQSRQRHIIKARPNARNISTQHLARLLRATCYMRLAIL